jgi:hypothetical protein
VFVYSMMAPLSPEDTARMVAHCCAQARSALTFSPASIERTYFLTNGVLRELMRLCEVAYMFADANGVVAIEPDLVDLAFEHVRRL